MQQYQYDQKEQSFLEYITIINQKFPGKWYIFINNIINNRRVTYFKNTTSIINVYDLSINNVITLYEILKQMKLLKVVNKVINKGEFIIVHYYNEKIVEYLKDSTKWYHYLLYSNLQKKFPHVKCVFDPENNIADLVIITKNYQYHFTSKYKELSNNNRIKKAIVCDKPYTMFYSNLYDDVINFSSNDDDFMSNINEFINNLII